MRVRVYWNVHRGCWSVQGRAPDGHWRVVEHAQELELEDARFVVSRLGRARAQRLGKKVVHAFVEGELAAGAAAAYRGRWAAVRYNPFRGPAFFHDGCGQEVCTARLVSLSPDRRVKVAR